MARNPVLRARSQSLAGLRESGVWEDPTGECVMNSGRRRVARLQTPPGAVPASAVNGGKLRSRYAFLNPGFGSRRQTDATVRPEQRACDWVSQDCHPPSELRPGITVFILARAFRGTQ